MNDEASRRGYSRFFAHVTGNSPYPYQDRRVLLPTQSEITDAGDRDVAPPSPTTIGDALVKIVVGCQA